MKDAFARIKEYREHPSVMVRELFGAEPDPWQHEVLEMFPHNQRMAMKAAKGPGKSTILAWLAWNFLLTRPHPKIAATSITADTLADTLWAEMAKWQQKSELLKAMFEWQKTRIFAKHHPETWFMSARSWAKSADPAQQGNTLAGLHADYILFLLDEAGGIPDSIMAAAEAALSSCIEGHLVIAGNPTHLEGPLYRACTTERRLWQVIEITGDPDDPMRSPRISVQWAREQIEKYGRDNPWVLVNVFGRFPPASINTLLGPDDLSDAMKRMYREHQYAYSPMILGIDVARYGDDASVIFPRQGLQAFAPKVLRNVDGVQGAGWASREWDDHDADACFIDDTGGYGASWIDALRTMNRQPIPIAFSEKPTNMRYYNKRAEMYFLMAEWVKDGGALPNCPELTQALTQTTYSFKGDRLLLEDKDQIKQRLGFSPDHADALCLTWAHPVGTRKRDEFAGLRRKPVHQSDYNPMAQMYARGKPKDPRYRG